MVSVFAATAFASDCKVNGADIGDEYVGGCENGLAHGKGKLKDKVTYEGEFKEGNKHGNGTQIWEDGSKYKGGWKNNDFHGKSIIAWANGSTYEGEWLNGSMTGFGIRTSARGVSDAKKSGLGEWLGDVYVERGYFKDFKLQYTCTSPQNCKQEQAKREAQERRDQAARDEQYRRDAPARQARQMCEAQKQTCYASCPPRAEGFRLDSSARVQCVIQCDRINCN